jgi:hypothetical protein
MRAASANEMAGTGRAPAGRSHLRRVEEWYDCAN